MRAEVDAGIGGIGGHFEGYLEVDCFCPNGVAASINCGESRAATAAAAPQFGLVLLLTSPFHLEAVSAHEAKGVRVSQFWGYRTPRSLTATMLRVMSTHPSRVSLGCLPVWARARQCPPPT